jgi:hypothetical protein
VRGEVLDQRWGVGLGLTVLVFWGVLDALARNWPGMGLPLLLLLVALGAGAVVELSGFGSLAQMAGVLAAVLGSTALVSWWQPSTLPSRSAVPAVAVLLPGLLFQGYYVSFSEVPLASYLLVGVAPLALAGSALLPLRGRVRVVVYVATVLVLVGLAVLLAHLATRDEPIAALRPWDRIPILSHGCRPSLTRI